MIRITIETEHLKSVVENPNGITLNDALDLFGGAIKAVGFAYKGEIIIEDDYDD
jgi:hypothetical protein